MSYVPNELLARLIGARLYSVEFGADHVQLRFENADSFHMPFLSLDCMPVVSRDASTYWSADPGYADALRALLGLEVTGTAEEAGRGLRVELGGGWIGIDPVVGELVGDEIATLAGFDDGSTQVWRPGEDTFAALG
jgi:hypothetical protein